jgi:hypothetical protein
MKALIAAVYSLPMAGFMALVGMAIAWGLSDALPFSPAYGRAALWGLLQLGLVGLTFVLSIRNVYGLGVFLATLPIGAGWGAASLGLFRLAGILPGPYLFSAAFMASASVLILTILVACLSRKPEA